MEKRISRLKAGAAKSLAKIRESGGLVVSYTSTSCPDLETRALPFFGIPDAVRPDAPTRLGAVRGGAVTAPGAVARPAAFPPDGQVYDARRSRRCARKAREHPRMPLDLATIEDIRSDLFAEDVEIPPRGHAVVVTGGGRKVFRLWWH